MPVYKLFEEMPYEELLGWIAYFDRRPIGWREDLRTSYIMGTFGDKRRPTEMFPSLATIYASSNQNAGTSLKGSLLFSRMLSAKGGDKLKALED